jgi:AcrR family transcriptional regulator
VVTYQRGKPRKRRAVTEALKEARREAILAAASALFCKEPFESLAMSELAAAADIAKGTLYLYFRSKEEIFLALLAREYSAWFAAFRETLRQAASAEEALDWIVASLCARGELVHLVGLLHAVLERNVPAATARAFKQGVDAGVGAVAPDIARVLRLGGEAEARRFLHWLQASIVGIHQLSSPAPAIRAAMAAEPGLAAATIDFRQELRAMLGALVAGMRQKENPR